jgi:hypothetical protein
VSTPIAIALIALAGAIGSAVISGVIGTLLGSYLQRRSIEHQISFASLHERRAGVIDHLYKLVVKAQRELPLWIRRDDREHANEQGTKWLDAMSELDEYYREHALWLDNGSRRKVEIFLKEIARLAQEAGELALSEDLPEYGDPASFRERVRENPELGQAYLESFHRSRESRERISDELDAVREALENEFRRILGSAR